MPLFGHHVAVEFFGHEFSPETPMEHVLAFGITGVVLALVAYGAYAATRDFRHWLRRHKDQPATRPG